MFDQLKHKWGPRICAWVPLDIWHRVLGVELLLPYYHMVSDQQLAHVSGLSKYRNERQFKADLEFFLRSYAPVSLQDVLRHLDGQQGLPKRCFLLTFDDGFSQMYNVVAPILYARGIPAVFFLTTSAVDNLGLCHPQKKSLIIDSLSLRRNLRVVRQTSQVLMDAGITGLDLPSRFRSITYRQRHLLDQLASILECDFESYISSVKPYLTTEQVRALIDMGFSIGAHGVDHSPYWELSLDEQLLQTRESLCWLSERFNYECNAFAFPHSDAGVSLEFFKAAFADGRLKVSFGTHGMHCHFFERNLTRFPMDDDDRKAVNMLAREFAVALLRSPPWARR